MAKFFVPHSQEIPSGFEKRFEVFGMGPKAAKDLARKLSLTKPSGPIIILGSAGGLETSLRAGQCFVVSEILGKGFRERLHIPREIEFLPQTALTSVEKPVTRADDKSQLGRSSGCQIVDCEMAFIWEEISDDLKPQLIFVRGVLDPADENLDFLEDYQIRWQSLLRPRNLLQFFRFVRNFFRYQKAMREFYIRMSDALMLREDTEISKINR